MENILYDFTLTRRQAALYEICVISVGILLGIHFSKTLKKVYRLRWVLAVPIGVYILILYIGQ